MMLPEIIDTTRLPATTGAHSRHEPTMTNDLTLCNATVRVEPESCRTAHVPQSCLVERPPRTVA